MWSGRYLSWKKHIGFNGSNNVLIQYLTKVLTGTLYYTIQNTQVQLLARRPSYACCYFHKSRIDKYHSIFFRAALSHDVDNQCIWFIESKSFLNDNKKFSLNLLLLSLHLAMLSNCFWHRKALCFLILNNPFIIS